MRILDLDLQKMFKVMSNDELKQFEDLVRYYYGDYENNYVKNDVITKILQKMGREDLLNMVSDDKAIADIQDENEKTITQLKMLVPPDSRRIPQVSLHYLIETTKILNLCPEYISDHSNMTFDQLKKLSQEVPMHYGEEIVDQKYGIDTRKIYKILEVLEAKAHAKELVSKIPKKEFPKIKKSFEDFRNFSFIRFSNKINEMEAMLDEIFKDQDYDSSLIAFRGNMADFADAF